MTEENNRNEGNVVPLYGKDEMNLVEFPFGPITATGVKTLEVEHQAFDRVLKREVTRQLIMTGSDKWGLPRPIDDQVLLGLKTLTHEAGFASPQIVFSRYQLCRAIGWELDGRTYRRLEQSIDRIAGTTFKFKDAWWDNGEKEYKSKTFHLITDVEICSRDQLDRSRIATGRTEQQLCSVRWGEAIWKSFQDGFIRTLDMRMFRRIAQGRRREVPLRLYRILDKRFWHAPVARFNLSRLCIGTLGLSPTYSPSQMKRVLDRAAAWLVECGCLHDYRYATERSVDVVYFREKSVADVAKKTIRASHRPSGDMRHTQAVARVADGRGTLVARVSCPGGGFWFRVRTDDRRRRTSEGSSSPRRKTNPAGIRSALRRAPAVGPAELRRRRLTRGRPETVLRSVTATGVRRCAPPNASRASYLRGLNRSLSSARDRAMIASSPPTDLPHRRVVQPAAVVRAGGVQASQVLAWQRLLPRRF